MTCPRSRSWEVGEPGFKSSSAIAKGPLSAAVPWDPGCLGLPSPRSQGADAQCPTISITMSMSILETQLPGDGLGPSQAGRCLHLCRNEGLGPKEALGGGVDGWGECPGGGAPCPLLGVGVGGSQGSLYPSAQPQLARLNYLRGQGTGFSAPSLLGDLRQPLAFSELQFS